MHYLLFYDYVENAVLRRAPFREEHLRLAREAVARGELLLGGAFAEPVDGAALSSERTIRPSSRPSSAATPTSRTASSPAGASGPGRWSSAGHPT